MKQLLLAVFGIALLAGCKTLSPMSHEVFRATVTLGEQFALEQHPEAIPHVRAGASVVCSVAHSTNVSPAEIVKALQASGITNSTAKLILNGSLAIFNVVVRAVGTNQTEIRLYAQDLCQGMQDGLPQQEVVIESAVARQTTKRSPVPHL